MAARTRRVVGGMRRRLTLGVPTGRALPIALPLCTVIALWLVAAPGIAAPSETEAKAEDAPTEVGPNIPLPPIPELEPIESPVPRAAAVKALSGRLDQLMATRVDDPLDASGLDFLRADLDDDIVPAIRARMVELREKMDGAAAELLLERARDAGAKALKEAGSDADGDWLVFMLSRSKSESDTWRDCVSLYGMLRMLEAVGTTPAVRQMIESYSFFGELVRIDLQRAFVRLGDKSVAALIEAREHDARKVRRWASRQLDTLGRAIPGEAVSTTDPQVLADVLRAFGRTQNLDATRVVLSFASSDRAQLRKAAREAIGAIGEPAAWHLGDIYKNLTGERAPRDWDWKRTAREIFLVHDRARLAPVYAAMGEGLKALAENKHAEAVAAFDRVLSRAPLFPRRGEMPPAYLARADELAEEGKGTEAMILLRKARRLMPKEADTRDIAAKLAYLEAKELVEAGTPDRFLIERAIELAPDDPRPKALRAGLTEKAEKRETETKTYGAAIGVGVVALVLVILLVGVRRPKKKPPARTAPEGHAEQPGGQAEQVRPGDPADEPGEQGEAEAPVDERVPPESP